MRVLFTLFLFCIAALAAAQEPVSKSLFSGVAIGGIDTVAYHNNQTGKAIEGNKKYTFEWQGAVWRFSDQASLNKFAANPNAWVPEFNGHCANALSLGEGLIQTDGTVWSFFGDKLYLFYAERGLARWQKGDYTKYQRDAERAWGYLTGD